MNIMLFCNNKNLLGNKLVIYSTLYCNDTINWFIVLTEEIGEREERNIQNLVKYMDSESNVIFEQIDITYSLEEQYPYLLDCLYIAPDCITTQFFEDWYDKAKEGNSIVTINDSQERTCVAFINLETNRINNNATYVDYDDNGISTFLWGDATIEYFDSRIGDCGTFSFVFNMPIIFWFAGENKKVYTTDLEEWSQLYPDFYAYIKQIQLAETIYF